MLNASLSYSPDSNLGLLEITVERRLLTFILASTTFFFFYLFMLKNFGPPKGQNVPGGGAAVADADAGPAINPLVADANAKNGDKKNDEAITADADVNSEANDNEEKLPPAVVRPDRPKWISLGSMDPKSQHLMMVTLNSKGGGIERIELTARKENGKFKYRRVDTRSGYLGYFAGDTIDEVTGVRVNVVGDGTPAATAVQANAKAVGIKIGDIIVRVGERTITTPEDIRDALADTSPDDQIEVEVLRGAANADNDEGAAKPNSLTFNATLSEHPLDLVRLAKYGGDDQVAGNLSRQSCLLMLGQVNNRSIKTGEVKLDKLADATTLNWNAATANVGDTETAIFDVELSDAEMESVGGESVRVTRSYSLPPNSYALDMAVKVQNLGKETQKLAYRLEGINGVTMEGWWYSNKVTPSWSRAAARDITYRTKAEGHEMITGCNLLKRVRNEPEDPDQGIFSEGGDENDRSLNYIGVDTQYFDCAYVPKAGNEAMTYFRRASARIVADETLVKKHQEHAINSSFYLDSLAANVPPGKELSHSFRLFAGPKTPEEVGKYGLDDCIYYGWFWFFAQFLVKVLHFLYAVFGNYAAAIIVLTVMVRGLMFPLSRKAAVNAQRMQELAPELKKIAEQYKDDMEGRLKAQRELQKRVGFNPMAGCLPMFLQLPIFIGLYRALSVDIELRQAPFMQSSNWASNLSAPDMLTQWDSWMMEFFAGRGIGWLGPYFNILPMIVVVLFLTQQKLFMPPATDEQTAMTQKLMGFMTLFMGLFFFRVPAGLCLYFIASSLWGICERVLVKKTLPKSKHFDQSVIDGTLTIDSTATKKQSIADKIREQIKPPEPTTLPPNKRKRPPKPKKK